MVAEFDLIRRYFKTLVGAEGFGRGLQDDCAHIPQAALQGDMVLTVDTLIEGVHFLPTDPPETLARKALRVNLSDLASKGARPLGCLLALSLPKDRARSDAWLQAFSEGLGEDLKQYDLQLLGGDTTSGPGPLSLSITLLGLVPSRQGQDPAMLRGQGQEGQLLCVTGTIGLGFLGLKVLAEGLTLPQPLADQASERYRLPEPRLVEGQMLRESGSVGACMDISDGLLADARHLAEASGLCAEIELNNVPLAAPFLSDESLGPLAQISGGDDYELLFSCQESEAERLIQRLGRGAIIGRLTNGRGLTLLGPNRERLRTPHEGYIHGYD